MISNPTGILVFKAKTGREEGVERGKRKGKRSNSALSA